MRRIHLLYSRWKDAMERRTAVLLLLQYVDTKDLQVEEPD